MAASHQMPRLASLSPVLLGEQEPLHFLTVWGSREGLRPSCTFSSGLERSPVIMGRE